MWKKKLKEPSRNGYIFLLTKFYLVEVFLNRPVIYLPKSFIFRIFNAIIKKVEHFRDTCPINHFQINDKYYCKKVALIRWIRWPFSGGIILLLNTFRHIEKQIRHCDYYWSSDRPWHCVPHKNYPLSKNSFQVLAIFTKKNSAA